MAGYEQCIIIGNAGRDAEMRYTQSGTPVTGFSVAVTNRWRDRQTQELRERTNWYNVSCWGRLAETAAQLVKKGQQIMVVGSVTARPYMGNDGQPRASLDLRADNFQLLGSRGDNEGDNRSYDDDDFSPPPNDVDDIPF